MQIFFNQQGLVDFNSETINALKEALPFAELSFIPDKNYNAEVIIAYPQQVMKEDLSRYPRLKAIHVLSSGYDELDLELIKGRGIRLFNARATNSVAISEFVIGQILSMNYNLIKYHELQAQKIWHRHLTSKEISGSNALILGAGAIGENLGLRLSAMGVQVHGYRRKNQNQPGFAKITTSIAKVKENLALFDYVIIALPLSEDTKNLIDEDWLSRMKKSALLINVARGSIIDEKALLNALNAETIRGAILDVTVKEPLPIDSPLWEAKNLILTPHVAFYSDKYLANVLSLLVTNLKAYYEDRTVETEIIL